MKEFRAPGQGLLALDGHKSQGQSGWCVLRLAVRAPSSEVVVVVVVVIVIVVIGAVFNRVFASLDRTQGTATELAVRSFWLSTTGGFGDS